MKLNFDVVYFQVFGSRIRVDSVAKVAELELAEKEKMKEKVDLILKHNCTVFINRWAAREFCFVTFWLINL